MRNILYLLMTYFLWSGIFLNNKVLFGYTKGQMLTYVLLLLVMRSIVLASSSADAVGGEIASGDLSNYLLKPFGYFKYWFIRDISNKCFNFIFASIEMGILWYLFRPSLFFPSSLITLLAFFVMACLAAVIFYFLSMGFKFVAFWAPENTWGLTFLMLVLLEALAGALFPLDILPSFLQTALSFTPFPYLVYYPVAVYLGKISGFALLRIFVQALVVALACFLVSSQIWKRGLKMYSAEGR